MPGAQVKVRAFALEICAGSCPLRTSVRDLFSAPHLQRAPVEVQSRSWTACRAAASRSLALKGVMARKPTSEVETSLTTTRVSAAGLQGAHRKYVGGASYLRRETQSDPHCAAARVPILELRHAQGREATPLACA